MLQISNKLNVKDIRAVMMVHVFPKLQFLFIILTFVSKCSLLKHKNLNITVAM